MRTSLPLLLLALLSTARAAEPRPRVVAYVPNWIDLSVFAPKIDYPRLTHIDIAFENPIGDEGALSFHAGDEAVLRLGHEHGVQVLVSLGGGSASKDPVMRARYARLLQADRRPAFVRALAEYVVAHGFDGLDVDLEGPALTGDYGPFVAELGTALTARGKTLTAALSQGYGGAKVPETAFASLAFINIMAYDATGPWKPSQPGPHASFDYAKKNVEYWLGRGLPRDKAVLGVPFYGQGFGAAARPHGYPWSEVVRTFPGAEAAEEAGSTIYYNSPATIRAKAAWVKEQSLGGIMIWSLNQDAEGPRALLPAITAGLSKL